MLGSVFSIFIFIFTIGLLIGFHEFGHFLAARWCGIKILRFAIGLGPIIWRKTDWRGTEYVVAAIPLGGYVKMLDEREGEVSLAEQHMAFNRQSLAKRALVIGAGPLFNFVLAFLAFWLMFVIGIRFPLPIIGEVLPGSIAQQAHLAVGQKIVAIQGEKTDSWQDVIIALLKQMGKSQHVFFTVAQPDLNVANKDFSLNIKAWVLDDTRPDLLQSVGIKPYQPLLPPIIKKVYIDQAAARAGLHAGDLITAFNDKGIATWRDLISQVHSHPKQVVKIKLVRDGKPYTLSVAIDERMTWRGDKLGYLGIETQPAEWLPQYAPNNQYSLLNALTPAWHETNRCIQFNSIVLKKILTGVISLKSLGGPISIFSETNAAAKQGFAHYLYYLALLSITLAMINLLPIPGLDGAHLVYLLIELLSGKPLSLRTQVLVFRLGMIFLLILMIQTVVNDLQRL